jgi:predicted enzyme related to lactoylglutathione lyase
MATTQTLRGFATVSYYAADMAAARKWYTELLGIEPYFAKPNAENPAYLEFRVGDYQHELGIIDSKYAPHQAGAAPSGTIMYWHVDNLEEMLERVKGMGATEHEGITERGAGFVTASVVDPFGNILGLMYNPHYVEILGSLKK